MDKNIAESRLRKILYIVLTGLFLLAFAQGFTIGPVAKILSSEKQIVKQSQWITNHFQMGRQRADIYSIQIPETLGNELVLCVKSYNADLEVLLDGEQIYTYQHEFGEHGICWKWIELPENVAGKELILRERYQSIWEDPLVSENIYLGNQNTVFVKLLKDDLFALILGNLIVLAGLVIGLGMWILRKRLLPDVRRGIKYLMLFILSSGAWIITDSSALQFVTGWTTVTMLFSFGFFMLMPYFLLRFIRNMMVRRTNGVMVLAHLHLLNAAVCILLHIFRILPLQRTAIFTHILILVSVVYIVREEIREVRKHNNREMKVILEGMFAMIFCVEVALVCFYVNLNLPYAVFFGIGISIFECFLIRAAFIRIYYYFDNSAHADEYREIAYKDSMTQMGNRVAFTKQQESGSWVENRSYIVMDINNLKKVNDMEGHLEGDKLIMGAGKCIREAFGVIGNCYRIGGDEFAVISGTDSEEEIKAAISRLEQAAARENKDRTVPIEIAYGYSVRREETVSNQAAFEEADVRMYAKKQEMKANKEGQK